MSNQQTKGERTMSKEFVEDVFNMKKETILGQLKKEGHYLHCNKQYGFVYHCVHKIKNCLYNITLGIKNGKIKIIDMAIA